MSDQIRPHEPQPTDVELSEEDLESVAGGAKPINILPVPPIICPPIIIDDPIIIELPYPIDTAL